MEITNIPINALKEIELFDIVVLHHGFEIYNRDYYFIIESGTKNNKGTFKILFTHCFDLQYRHKYANKEQVDLLRKSWADDLISPSVPKNEEGYWWGQGFTSSYPGFSYNPDSPLAKELTEISAKPMYAVNLETEHYKIDFIFHDFKYSFISENSSISDKLFIPLENCNKNKDFNNPK